VKKVKNNKDILLDKIEKLGIDIIKIRGDEVDCRCPMKDKHSHGDKNGSFGFNLKTEEFCCFVGCLKGRGIHQLVYQVTGVSEAGAPVQEPVQKKFIEHREKDKKIIPTIPFLPIAINNRGEDYLLRRGLSTQSIEKWGIRFWDERNAVVIPIEDKGYALRFLEIPKTGPDEGKKYKFIVGTKISDTLFGLSKLPEYVKNVILVEGSLDCIYMHQLGFTNTLALLHADISQQQIKMLGGVTDVVYIMLDGDKTGRTASEKVKVLLNHRFIKKICYLPEGKDPDNLSKEEIEKILKEAK
jgi:DNA primase